jgi:hypothetical protein
MWPGNKSWTLSWIAVVLLLLLFVMAGCAEVEVIDATPATSAAEPFTSPLDDGSTEHNLSVLAVDFDPPLDYQHLILRRQSVTLLVAIENRGNSTERDITVQVHLTSPENPDLLLTQGASVASIAPGEIQIVPFARLGEIPYHQSYHLEVVVDAVVGESTLGDNRKAFDIQIHQE